MLINRYLSREILAPMVTICSILVIIFAGYSITRYLPDAANGMMSGKTVLALVFLKILIALEVLIPITLFFSVITVLGRMHAESEIIAMEACGFGERKLLSAVLRLSLLIAVLVAGLSLYARPWAYEKSYWLKADAKANFDLSRLTPGRFHEIGGNDLVVFLETLVDGRGHAKGVFIQQYTDTVRKITRAKEAWQESDPVTDAKSIVLREGYHYELARDGSNVRFFQFHGFQVPLVPKEITSLRYRRKAAPTRSLAISTAPEDKAEFQWRISTGFSTVLLGLLAVPLCRSAPRQGKHSKTFLAVIVFAAYYIMTVVAKTWMEQEVVGSFPGIWWPHILLAALLVIMLMRSNSG
ncbi:MAG: LPS export ABC transporter permease LptF, partial [Desulfuromusa sp.]|nr:LPS export ABC transporter permease LptF [Desulfuromusa sp.]